MYTGTGLGGEVRDMLSPLSPHDASCSKVTRTKATLAKLMGRGRVHETPALLAAHVRSVMHMVDLNDVNPLTIDLSFFSVLTLAHAHVWPDDRRFHPGLPLHLTLHPKHGVRVHSEHRGTPPRTSRQ